MSSWLSKWGLQETAFACSVSCLHFLSIKSNIKNSFLLVFVRIWPVDMQNESEMSERYSLRFYLGFFCPVKCCQNALWSHVSGMARSSSGGTESQDALVENSVIFFSSKRDTCDAASGPTSLHSSSSYLSGCPPQVYLQFCRRCRAKLPRQRREGQYLKAK